MEAKAKEYDFHFSPDGAVTHYQNLCLDAIKDVIYGRALIAVVPEFVPALLAEKMVQKISASAFTGYKTAPDVKKALGEAFYETVDSADAVERYFAEALEKNHAMRGLFSPYLHPIDRLRLLLDEIWPGGAMLLKNKSLQPMFVGLVRGFDADGEALPHVDHVKMDDVMGVLEGAPNAQVAANLHLKSAEGGEIEVYDFKTTPKTAQELKRSDCYSMDLAKIPKGTKKASYHANVGDLVFFDSTRIHAVKPVAKGTRVTASCFLWMESLYRPLRLFS